MENELEVVNIRLVKEPSLYSEQTLDSPQAVVELMAKELSQYDREVFCILNMKNNGQVVSDSMIDGIGIHHTYYHCLCLLIFN